MKYIDVKKSVQTSRTLWEKQTRINNTLKFSDMSPMYMYAVPNSNEKCIERLCTKQMMTVIESINKQRENWSKIIESKLHNWGFQTWWQNYY